MSKAESSSSDSSSDASDTDSSSDISSSDSDRESNSLDDPRDRRSHRRSSTPPRQYRRDPPAADNMTVGSRHYRPVTVGSRHAADGMIAGPHCYLALAETTIDATMIEVVTAVIVVSHPPLGGIVSVATRSRGHHPVSVLCHAERAHGTGNVLVIMTAE